MAIVIDIGQVDTVQLGMVPGGAPWMRLTLRPHGGGDAHSIDIETSKYPRERIQRAAEAFEAVLNGATMLPVYPARDVQPADDRVASRAA